MNTYSLTDQGKVRSKNQDYFANYFHSQFALYLVADGMGGHRAGEVASRIAVEETRNYVIEHKADGDYGALLVDALHYANRCIYDASSANPDYEQMGTTIVAVLQSGGRCWVAHVGDSRVYLMREGTLRRLTQDHSLVQNLVEQGLLSPEDARTHPERSAVTRAMGVFPDVEVDCSELPLREGDRVLLCTDGVTNMVEESEIEEILVQKPVSREACEALLERANEHGGLDNVTATIFEYRS